MIGGPPRLRGRPSKKKRCNACSVSLLTDCVFPGVKSGTRRRLGAWLWTAFNQKRMFEIFHLASTISTVPGTGFRLGFTHGPGHVGP